MNPQTTYAIVVGIEKYEVGEGNNLNGPARDAGKFASWLRQKQVPAQNISLFISPLPENNDFSYLPTELSATVQEATVAKITDFIENKLESLNPELLFFYWAGHGVINLAGERRLFYADATQKSLKNLDFNALQSFLRTDYFGSKASRQIMIVDACANYVENMVGGVANRLPEGNPFPSYNPVANREQFILLAAKPGELASNIAAEQTGLFSKEVMAQLENLPQNEWPPNMDTVTTQLKQRFVTLREKGRAEQTPTISYYKDWQSNEKTLVDTPNQPQTVISSTIELSIQQKMQLVDALLKCPSMQRSNREALLRQMRSYIFHAIDYSSQDRLHVLNIVDTCRNYNGGIAELVSTLRLFDGETNAFRELEGLLEREFVGLL